MQLLIIVIIAVPSMVGARTVLDAARNFWHIQKVLQNDQVEYLLKQKANK